MRRLLLVTALILGSVLVSATVVRAQEREQTEAAAPIQDNSFLVEEAYNQERGVVQHVGTFAQAPEPGSWVYTLTQEWPVAGQRHQLSYTLPLAHATMASGGRTGIGDVALSYRYQILGVGGGAIALAPRATLLLPTGSSSRGLGRGGAGIETNLPFSAELPASLVVHSNMGATYTPRARDHLGNTAATLDYTLAQSVVWHALPRLDLMLEAAWTRAQEVSGPNRVARSTEALLAPGIRAAFDFASGLQIVPGLAFPIGVGPSSGERSVFVYLSFEHPFTNQTP
ncbi:MAG TPA: hypothetical protein VIQ74_02060 [Gemmatimonadaceae bacterium]